MNKFLNEFLNSNTHILVKTSGSTGAPKTLNVEKSKMCYSALQTCKFLELKKGDLALLCLPTEYISGQMMIVRSLVSELKLIETTPNLYPLKNINQTFDFCAMTPLQVENSLDKIHLIKNLIIGGTSISSQLILKIREKLIHHHKENRVFETYGMSETLSHIALKEIFPKNNQYFTIFEDIKISLDNRNCLVIDAPKLNDNLLITNDLVEIISEKEFKVLGRLDFVINSGGAKIQPEILENQLKLVLKNELVFCGLPDEKLGQKLVLVIESAENEEVINFINNFTWEKKYYKPKKIYFLKNFVRTKNGKLNRNTILNQLIDLENEGL